MLKIRYQSERLICSYSTCCQNRKMQFVIQGGKNVERILQRIDIEQIVRIQSRYSRVKLISESLTQNGIMYRPGKRVRKVKKRIALSNKIGHKIKLPLFKGLMNLARWKD